MTNVDLAVIEAAQERILGKFDGTESRTASVSLPVMTTSQRQAIFSFVEAKGLDSEMRGEKEGKYWLKITKATKRKKRKPRGGM